MLLPKLCYPLIATTDQGAMPSNPTTCVHQGLSEMGVNWHFPQVAVHGLQAYQGLNIPNLFMEQMIIHIQTLVKFEYHGADPKCRHVENYSS